MFTVLVLQLAMLLSVLGMFGLYGTLVARSGRPDALALSGATLAALSALCISALLYVDKTAGSLGWLRSAALGSGSDVGRETEEDE